MTDVKSWTVGKTQRKTSDRVKRYSFFSCDPCDKIFNSLRVIFQTLTYLSDPITHSLNSYDFADQFDKHIGFVVYETVTRLIKKDDCFLISFDRALLKQVSFLRPYNYKQI